MILEKKLKNEYHPNGKLAYTQTIAILAPLFADTYNQCYVRIHPDGYQWMRVGEHAKYYDNGQLAWRFVYNDNGDVIEAGRQYRKDGSVIIY